ncbi:hypothetical protein [Variovorax paradoxus]|uniref:hypothetical protein n=1 Tax=Variovorax paradoxus TaxID=34073 RepID=UPI0012D4AB3E|nr:hypothetical protein [Variovorax paradoxus]
MTTSISMAGLSHPDCYQKRSINQKRDGRKSPLRPEENASMGGLRRAKKKRRPAAPFQVQHGFSIGSLEEFLL